jgi:mannose/fructose/N-acetylgalactosamine-specific phosphotransferase system component IIC
MQKALSKQRIWLARGIAVAADVLQIVFFGIMVEGFASPADAVVDVIVAIVLTLLVGWHIAFIPSFIVKALPFADLAPTWTIAVLIATRGRQTPSEP